MPMARVVREVVIDADNMWGRRSYTGFIIGGWTKKQSGIKEIFGCGRNRRRYDPGNDNFSQRMSVKEKMQTF